MESLVQYVIIGIFLIIIIGLIVLLNLNLSIQGTKSVVAQIIGGLLGSIISGLFAIFVVKLQKTESDNKDEKETNEKINSTKKYIKVTCSKLSNKIRSIGYELEKSYIKNENNTEEFIAFFNGEKEKLENLNNEIIKVKSNLHAYLTSKNVNSKELELLLTVIDNLDEIINYYENILIYQESDRDTRHIYWAIGDFIVRGKRLDQLIYKYL